MPNVIGMTYDQALESFRQLETNTGVRVTVSQQSTQAGQGQQGTVISTSPDIGATIGYGELITLFVGA
jgi:beta-lactam-binding protein with PASTA domain